MNVLGIFVKHPVPGRVKTRLAAALGTERAASLYAAFVSDLAARFRATADRRLLCHTPDEPAAVDHFGDVSAGDYDLWPQPELSLGERMAEFFDREFAAGATRVVVIGSDSPTLPREMVERAFDELGAHQCVLGPTTDGGYYLIGQSGRARDVFDGVEWSTPTVLEQTVGRVVALGVRLAVLPPWYDVDTLEDLQMLRGHVRALDKAGTETNLDRTKPCLSWDTAAGLSPL